MKPLSAALLCALVAACATAISSIERQGDVFRIAVPETGLLLEFPAHGLSLEEADDSRPYYFLASDETGLNVSFSFEPATRCTTGEACRDYLSGRLKAGQPSTVDWHSSQVGEAFVSEYTISLGSDFAQRHMNAHFVKDGVWIDVHLSKVAYREAERELFVHFVRSIRFRPRA